MKKTFIPEEFRGKYRRLLGSEYEDFIKCCETKIPKSIWVNSLKANVKELKERLESQGAVLKHIPFHENAFDIEGIERPGSFPEFEEGLFNLQEKASMLPAIALEPKEGEMVLDMAAAPGNKTLQIACLMKGKGEITAIDKNILRFKSLNFNARKFGMAGIVNSLRMDALRLNSKDYFDKVLLDAPCSSEGLVRKHRDALKNWSQRLVERKAGLQKRLIVKCFDFLKKGGAIVYSTCSLSQEEDEEVVKHLLEQRNAATEELEFSGFKLRKGIEEIGYRVLPQDNDTQSFYLCRIRKL